MARVLLIHPPSPERLGTPLVSQQLVAASLLRAGHEVRVIDAGARNHSPDAAEIRREAEAFDPLVVGISLFTRWVWHAYGLARELKGLGAVMVGGGAHATARPEEPLEHGFDASIAGEAEIAMPRLVAAVEGSEGFEGLAGVCWRGNDGVVRREPDAEFIADLDAVAEPLDAQHLYDPAWYGAEVAIGGGMLTSRGCPARCTFCANYVTGRGFRYRSAESVTAEIRRYHEEFGITFLPFWDDALTANLPRLRELCAALERLPFGFQWSAITRANMVNPEVLAAMKRAGCVAVNFGVESGDDGILRVIKKGVGTRHVVQALEWAKELELRTACNFMLGFPEDTVETLDNTRRFMERIAPMVDAFSTLGVAVPFPGTPLYEANFERYGFAEWWLREDHSRYSEPPDVNDYERFYRHYIDDANLELDFFRYSGGVRAAIAENLRYKAEHNLRRMGLAVRPAA